MGGPTLAIVSPAHRSRWRWGDKIVLQGDGDTSGLYCRWYANFAKVDFSKPDKPQYALLNVSKPSDSHELTEQDYRMGSHLIVLAATDQPTETLAALELVRHSVVTGGKGGKDCAGACIIHIFKANILSPLDNATITGDKVDLIAEAPLLWCDPDYQNYNHLQFEWRVTATAKGPDQEFVFQIDPDEFAFGFDEADTPCCMARCDLPDRDAFAPPYTFELRVVDKCEPTYVGATDTVTGVQRA